LQFGKGWWEETYVETWYLRGVRSSKDSLVLADAGLGGDEVGGLSARVGLPSFVKHTRSGKVAAVRFGYYLA
jgi:hypothetical protein